MFFMLQNLEYLSRSEDLCFFWRCGSENSFRQGLQDSAQGCEMWFDFLPNR